MKIIDVVWFSGSDQLVGIIAGKDENTGKIKFYIGSAVGNNEEIDKQHIASWGTKLYPEHMIDFLNRNLAKKDDKEQFKEATHG